jgi:Icc protein
VSASFQILQVSDPHLHAEDGARLYGIATADAFAAVLRQALTESRPDLLLVTGDLAQDESRGGYERLRDLLLPAGVPTAVIPGNHDDPALLGEVLEAAGIQVGGHVDTPHWRLVLLSTWARGDAGGRLTPAELATLDGRLAERPDAHGLVVLHHHPVPMGSRWLDTVGLRNPDEFFRVLAAHPSVRGLVWGHVHQAMDRRQDGLRLLSTPSTCYQFRPGSDDFALDDRPPGYRWLTLAADGTMDTRVGWLEQEVP